MRVLLISVDSEKSKGGVAEWTKKYKKACQQSEIECDIIDTSAIGIIATQITAKRNLFDEYHRFKRIQADLRKCLKHQSYDVVHFNTNIGFFGIIRDYYLARMIKQHNIPIFLHFHCDISFWDKNALTHMFIHRVLKITHCVFVLNTNSQMYLKTHYNTNSIVIPNFINDDQVIQEKTIKEHIRTCIFVGRVSFLKGIKEVYKVAKAYPNIMFKLVGEISEESKSLEPSKNIELMGIRSHEDVINLIDSADVFILPSYTEGFSIALLEAMGRGMPVIASDVGSNADMLENEGGIVVPLGQDLLWLEAMEKTKDHTVRKKMSEWNIQKVKNTYRSSIVMKTMIELYRVGIDS